MVPKIKGEAAPAQELAGVCTPSPEPAESGAAAGGGTWQQDPAADLAAGGSSPGAG